MADARQPVRRAKQAFDKVKAEYESKGRFDKMRIWVVALFAFNVSITLAYVVGLGRAEASFEAWYQPGFPSNLVVVDNKRDDSAKDVLLILDDKWFLKLSSLEPGKRGFHIDRDFRDSGNASPKASYRPQNLEVRVGDDKHKIPIGTKAEH